MCTYGIHSPYNRLRLLGNVPPASRTDRSRQPLSPRVVEVKFPIVTSNWRTIRLPRLLPLLSEKPASSCSDEAILYFAQQVGTRYMYPLCENCYLFGLRLQLRRTTTGVCQLKSISSLCAAPCFTPPVAWSAVGRWASVPSKCPAKWMNTGTMATTRYVDRAHVTKYKNVPAQKANTACREISLVIFTSRREGLPFSSKILNLCLLGTRRRTPQTLELRPPCPPPLC